VDQELFDWLLLLARWLHITVGVTWIGTSIFFMWLDRSFEKNLNSTHPGHVGDLWMVHGGGFYHVEKLLMGPTKVPEKLHWFKWESYWTWLSGMFLMTMIFYTGDGTFLLDETVSNISYGRAVALSLFSIFGSWFFYDFLWEMKLTKNKPIVGHVLTLIWFAGMSYFLCQMISGRAAYIHIGAMLGTWMTANVFMRIIPRQVMMVEATSRGEEVNPDFAKNAKARSTHNTYFTLPVIFIMLSNHFPATYGHEKNWLVLLLISAAGAAIREYFVKRLSAPARSYKFAVIAVALLVFVSIYIREKKAEPAPIVLNNPIENVVIDESKDETDAAHDVVESEKAQINQLIAEDQKVSNQRFIVKGTILFEGATPKGRKLTLPSACAKQFKGDVYTNEVMVNQGRLQNVVVRIVDDMTPYFAADEMSYTKQEYEIDQKGCIYEPRVSAVRVGQPVAFINSDPIFHNVKSYSKVNANFNINMPKLGQREIKYFEKPEIVLITKCSVHPWMSAYIAIIEHPFFSLSNAKGEFEIKNLPQGKFKLEFWHETLGVQTREIEVTESGISELSITYKKM